MSIAPGILFEVVGFPITNTIVTTLLTDIVLIVLVICISKTISLRPKGIQNAIEMAIDYFYTLTEDTAGKKVSFIYPWVLTFFLFIVISNLLAQFPGFESIRFHPVNYSGEEGVPLFRAATSDLNVTLALATISVIATNYLGIKHIGIKSYLSKFVSFKMFPIFMFVGILEFANELTKFISFSFRLLGNIFAGESMLSQMYHLFPIGVPLPFIALELMVAVIQALVFAMLTMAFMHIMTDKPQH
ncbi:MAG: F0F1 ATP synthase subunit A [Elusimicrobiota bacterium]|jgi:F-type H+-transporting ATPase subunit a|nr:F0F1 ATP synthase subunit A [Elusimicrobiota bacterium]